VASWIFRTPFVVEGPASWSDRLLIRIKLNRGVSVLEGPPATYRAVRFPTQDDLAAATSYYLGGYDAVVNDATKAALIAAGIGIDNSNFTPAP